MRTRKDEWKASETVERLTEDRIRNALIDVVEASCVLDLANKQIGEGGT